MRKWQVLAIVGFAFWIGGSGWALAERQRPAPRVYELRVYKLVDTIDARILEPTSYSGLR